MQVWQQPRRRRQAHFERRRLCIVAETVTPPVPIETAGMDEKQRSALVLAAPLLPRVKPAAALSIRARRLVGRDICGVVEFGESVWCSPTGARAAWISATRGAFMREEQLVGVVYVYDCDHADSRW